jgi:hypothetical protein
MHLFTIETTLPQIITAIGGLGTAAFGLVDASKAFAGSVNRIGFKGIKTAVTALTPARASGGLLQQNIIATLRANWFNGVDLASQKAIAKSLIKLNLDATNAAQVAAAAGVDADKLTTVATKIAAGTSLLPDESDFLGRFDLIVIASLDQAYQHADEVFRNRTRAWAMLVAILLAFGAACAACNGFKIGWQNASEALLAGLLATPLAPIAKDLSTALATAVKTLQLKK